MPTVALGSYTYDAYASIADADEYLAADVARAATWSLRNADAKARALVSATRMLLRLPWIGGAPSLTDPPLVVTDAASLLAADLATKPRLQSNPSGGSNVKTAKAGSAQVEFFEPTDRNLPSKKITPLPPEIWDMLVAAGLVAPIVPDGYATLNDVPIVTGTSCDPRYGYGYYWHDDGRQGGW